MKAGLMWSTAHRKGLGREDRKTHVFVEPDMLLPLCNPGLEARFFWDFDLAREAPAELAKRIEDTDPDKLVCRSCLKALKSRP